MSETTNGEGRRLGSTASISEAIKDVLSPRLRSLLETGRPPEGLAGNSYVKCKLCRDTGWVPEEGGVRRCPHAVAEDRRVRLEYHVKESGTGELGRTQTFETFDAGKCADPDTARASEFLNKPAANPNHARGGLFGERCPRATNPLGARALLPLLCYGHGHRPQA